MEQHERIKWLQENYCNYTTNWYQEDPKRTTAIFIKQYGVYLDNAFTDLKEQQIKMLDLRQTLCEESYYNQYGVSMDEDYKLLSRREVLNKVFNLEDKSYLDVIIP